MLEQPKKSGGKLVSHILASHGGDYEMCYESFLLSLASSSLRSDAGCLLCFRWHFHTLSSDLSDSNGRSPIYKWRMRWPSHRLQNQCKSNLFFQSIVSCICSEWMFCLHSSQLVHQAGVYASFCNIEEPGILPLPLDGLLVNCRVTSSIKFAWMYAFVHLDVEALWE